MKVPDVMSIKDALQLMRREQVLRLPIVNTDGVFQGILSINDFALDSEDERSKNKDNPQTFFTLVEQMKGSYMLLACNEEPPPAFDEKGHTPIERVFNEQKED